MKYILFVTCILFFTLACKDSIPAKNTDEISAQNNCFKICFGSCSDEDKPQKLWKDVLAENADVWIWLGDNIYGDSEDAEVLKTKYKKQKNNIDYQAMIKSMEIIGTWDDHDYGENNAGKHFKGKKGSQQELLDFLDVPKNDIRRSREGVYADYKYNHDSISMHVFLLDCRYFRDDQIVQEGTHIPNSTGTILGDDQWKWLEDKLKESEADIHIFASGIQVLPEQHRFEKWANFPNERTRFLNLLSASNVKVPLIISGDRHIGEISQIEHNGKTITEITSSSLTHGWSNRRTEENKHRKGDIVYDINYGLIQICLDNDSQIEALIKTTQRKVMAKTSATFLE